MRRALIAAGVIAIHLVPEFRARCDDPVGERPDPRMKYMDQMIESMDVKPVDRDSGLATQFHGNPLLRFGDPTRGARDGAIWKLGAGRPQVIVAMEFVYGQNVPKLNYEFLCLTAEKFVLQTSQGWTWTPADSALEFHTLDSDTPPHKSPVVRVRQMKGLARRFAARERYKGGEFDLRLMPEPIDRYSVDDSELRTGAVFVFANGTNPEVLLMLENNDTGWQYALARLCGAEPTAQFDGQTVWNLPTMDEVGKSWNLNYTSDAHPFEAALSGDVR
jgi:hypothetical protein